MTTSRFILSQFGINSLTSIYSEQKKKCVFDFELTRKDIANHLYKLFTEHHIPHTCTTSISIGCGQHAEDVAATQAYMTTPCYSLAFDSSRSAVATASSYLQGLPRVNLTVQDAVTLFNPNYLSTGLIKKNAYQFVCMRHPVLLDTVPKYRNRFGEIIEKTLPQLCSRTVSAYLFVSFFGRMELENFFLYFANQDDIILFQLSTIHDRDELLARSYDTSMGEGYVMVADEFSIAGHVIHVDSTVIRESDVITESNEILNDENLRLQIATAKVRKEIRTTTQLPIFPSNIIRDYCEPLTFFSFGKSIASTSCSADNENTFVRPKKETRYCCTC